MAPHVIRWGIISTGGIAVAFGKDLLVDPSTRDADDVSHRITAIGSRSTKSAQEFIDKLKGTSESEACHWGVKKGYMNDVKGYGSYEEVYNDPNVDAVYIGTPHTFHHRNSKDALLGGKHVLCEKPFTFDVEELDELIKISTERKLFLMEAVWTRWQPIAFEVQKIIHSGKLGKVKRFEADLSVENNLDSLPDDSRMIDPKLCGGSILDLGPYPSVWAMMVMHHHPDNKLKAPKLLSSHQKVYQRTKVDSNSRWLLNWENVGEAALTTDLACDGLSDGNVLVHCEEGVLAIDFPLYRPSTFHLLPNRGGGGKIKEKSTHHCPIPAGGGMSYEADETARCVRDKKLESARMPHEESRLVQSWFDEVRRAGDTILKDKKGTAGQ